MTWRILYDVTIYCQVGFTFILALKQLNEKFVCCNISHSSNSSMNNKIPGSNMFSYNLGLKELILSSTWEMHRYLQLVNF